jgi:deoxyribonuclease V
LQTKRGKFSIKKGHEIQQRLSKRLVFEDRLPERIKFIAGVDVAYHKDVSISAVAVLDYSTLSVVEFKFARVQTYFPYISTLLAFREIPSAYSAIKQLNIEPDVFLVDGQGFAHPYGLGFASHLGLILNKPTIGVAKNLLYGRSEHSTRNERVKFLKEKGDIVGAEVITKLGTNPIYVSVGHKISLKHAIEIVIDCTEKYRLPEPIRRAHIFANQEKRRINLF